MKKIILAVLGGLLIIAGVVLFLNLSNVVKAAIETAGSNATGTPVRVSGLKLSLANKTAGLSGLSIANPKGFKTDEFLTAKAISVALGDVTKEVVQIKEIVVDGMTVTYELGKQGTNFDALKQSIKSSSAQKSAESKKGAGDKSGPDLIIQQLRITHAEVIPVLGGAEAPIKLPDIVLNNIGNKNSPATASQVASQIMQKVLASSSAAVLKAKLNIPSGATMDKATGALKGLLSR